MTAEETVKHVWELVHEAKDNEAKELLKNSMNVDCVNEEYENFREKERESHDEAIEWLTRVIKITREYSGEDKEYWDLEYESREYERQATEAKTEDERWHLMEKSFAKHEEATNWLLQLHGLTKEVQ